MENEEKPNDDISQKLIDEIGLVSTRAEIEKAIFIAENPKNPNQLIIWNKGSQIDAAALSAQYIRFIKCELAKMLDV